jgi:hypothetical protein
MNAAVGANEIREKPDATFIRFLHRDQGRKRSTSVEEPINAIPANRVRKASKAAIMATIR